MKLGEKATTASTNGALEPGSVLDGRFAIVETISRGGMATVFKARDLANGDAWVAVKIPHPNVEMDVALFSRFQREDAIGTTLDHPSILKFFPVENKSRPYLVMEFLRGTTLFHVLHQRGPLPEAEALSLAARICEALEYLATRGILHRDLKPENVMMCEDGTIRLMDFGISRAKELRRLTFIGFAPGTPHYMAPERVKGKSGDTRTDVSSLGAILYEMLTGVIAFNDEDITVIMDARVTGDPEAPRALNPKISPQTEEIVLRAMERDPDRRYPSAAAMKADLLAPAQVAMTGRCNHLKVSTPAIRRWRKIRWVAFWIAVPVAAQVLLFLFIRHHLTKH
jgi:serine/threonine protein kinase